MPDPWAVLSEGSPRCRSLKRLKERFAALSEPDFPLLFEFSGVIDGVSSHAFTPSRSDRWWGDWERSSECALLQQCMAAALGALPAAARKAALLQASSQDQRIVICTSISCISLVRCHAMQMEGYRSLWLQDWIRDPGRIEALARVALAALRIKVPAQSAAIAKGINCVIDYTADIVLFLDFDLHVPSVLKSELFGSALKASTSSLRICLPTLQQEGQQPFIGTGGQRADRFEHLGATVEVELAGVTEAWCLALKRIMALIIYGWGCPGQDLSMDMPFFLTDPAAWGILTPALLQAQQLGTDVISIQPGGARWVNRILGGTEYILEILTRQPAACIHGPLPQIKAAGATIRAILISPGATLPQDADHHQVGHLCVCVCVCVGA